MKRSVFALTIAALAVLTLGVGVTLTATGPDRLSAFDGGVQAEPLVGNLPPVPRGPMTRTPSGTEATSVLSFDDGSCEAGLGVGSPAYVTDLVDFDVPTQCSTGGLDIVGVTARMNTGQSIQAFAFAQAGATPPIVGSVSTVALGTPIAALGPCPATTMVSAAIGPGAAVITDTMNFFAGVRVQGFVGRDTNGAAAGRMWLLCATCGQTRYSPAMLSGFGLGGNWMIRVTVEDDGCPVELMEFSVN